MLNIKRIKPEETLTIRQKILRPHLTIDECQYDIDYLEDSFHVGAFLENKLICIASFSKEINKDLPKEKQYRLRGMATLEEFRKLGAGRQVLDFAEEILKEREIDILWCNGRTGVQEYYEKIGFQSFGEVFSYPPSGPHLVMYKNLE